MNALGACGRPAWVGFRSGLVEPVIIQAPFPNIAGHVFDPKRTCAEWKGADRRAFRITVIDIAIAPGEDGVFVREVGEIAAALIISPRKFALIVSFGGVLPFRFGRQSILAAFVSTQPLTEFHGVEITDVNDRVTIARAGGALRLVCPIELFVLGVRSQATRNVKPADSHVMEWPLVRPSFLN